MLNIIIKLLEEKVAQYSYADCNEKHGLKFLKSCDLIDRGYKRRYPELSSLQEEASWINYLELI